MQTIQLVFSEILQNVQLGQMICFQYALFDKNQADWIRGKVVEIHNDSCIIHLVDYGLKVTCPSSVKMYGLTGFPETQDWEIAGLQLTFKSLPELDDAMLTVRFLSGNTESGYLAEFVQTEVPESIPNQAQSNVSSQIKSETTASKVSTVQTIQTGSAPSDVKKELLQYTKQPTEYSTDASSSIIDINTTQHEVYHYIIITKIKTSSKGQSRIYTHFCHSK